MPTYVSLTKWTEEGAKAAKDTVNRAEQLTKAIERMGGRFLALYWTVGAYDLVAISEFPDEDSAHAFLVQVAMSGSVRTETMRAFSKEDMQRILGKLG